MKSPGGRDARRTTSIAVSLIVVLLTFTAGVWAGFAIKRTGVTSPTLMTGTILDADTLYALGLAAITLDVANSGFTAELNQGPLFITADHVDRILHATYDAQDTADKAQAVLGDLLDFVHSYPEKRIFEVSIEDERPVLTDSLGVIVLAQYAALPDCGLGDDLSTLLGAARIRLFGGSGEEFFNESHPDCRPPDVVASRVEEGLAEAVEELRATGPDRIEVFPNDEDDEGFATLMEWVQRGLAASHPVWPLLLLSLGLVTHSLLGSWSSRGVPGSGLRAIWLPLGGFGAGLVAYGFAVKALAPTRIEELFADAGTEGEASEIWGELGSYAARQTAEWSADWALIVGAVIVGVAIVGTLVVRRALIRRPGPAAR